MKGSLVAILLGGMLVCLTVPATAGYGAPWTGSGTACLDDAALCFDARFQSSASGSFRLTLTDPDTGASLPPFVIAGREQFRNVVLGEGVHCPGSNQEWTFDYRASDDATDGVLFELTAAIVFCLNGPLDHLMFGTFTGHYLAFSLRIQHVRAV